MKWILILLVLLEALTVSAQKRKRGNEGGGGGDLVYVNGKYYLLDLLEAGVEENPYIDHSITPNPDYVQRLNSVLPAGFPNELIAKKMTEIERLNKMTALVLIRTIEAYQWKLVNSALLDIQDEFTDLDIPRQNLLQLAVRKSSTILVDRDLWKKIDVGNQVALVFHEVIYALHPPVNSGYMIWLGYHTGYKPIMYQMSEKAREVTGYLFSDMARQGFNGFGKFYSYRSLFFKSAVTAADGKQTDRVFEDGATLWSGPNLRLEVHSNKWRLHYMTADPIQLTLDDSDEVVNSHIEYACNVAVEENSGISLSDFGGEGLNVYPSSFHSNDDSRRGFIKMERKTNFTNFLLSHQRYNNLNECLAQVKNRVSKSFQDMQKNYK